MDPTRDHPRELPSHLRQFPLRHHSAPIVLPRAPVHGRVEVLWTPVTENRSGGCARASCSYGRGHNGPVRATIGPQRARIGPQLGHYGPESGHYARGKCRKRRGDAELWPKQGEFQVVAICPNRVERRVSKMHLLARRYFRRALDVAGFFAPATADVFRGASVRPLSSLASDFLGAINV
jgi:hypothetical protein